MKYCTNCGAQLTDDAMFCTNCGTPQEEAAKKNTPVDPVDSVLNPGLHVLHFANDPPAEYSPFSHI